VGSPPPGGFPPQAPPLSPPSFPPLGKAHTCSSQSSLQSSPLQPSPCNKSTITQPDRMPRPHCKAPTHNWNGAQGTGLHDLPEHPLPSLSQGNLSSCLHRNSGVTEHAHCPHTTTRHPSPSIGLSHISCSSLLPSSHLTAQSRQHTTLPFGPA